LGSVENLPAVAVKGSFNAAATYCMGGKRSKNFKLLMHCWSGRHPDVSALISAHGLGDWMADLARQAPQFNSP
jgi:hypothetical protein